MFQLNEKIHLAVFDIEFQPKNLLQPIVGGKNFTKKNSVLFP